LDPNNFTFY